MEMNKNIRMTPMQKQLLELLARREDPEAGIDVLEIREKSSLTRGGFQKNYSLTEKGWEAINALKEEQS